ncbi:MAG TPA: BtpA/SgcQ family protein [Patescibacteria group bacterium]
MEKPIIAMLHVWDGSTEQTDAALRDLEVLGPLVDGVLVENYGWGYQDPNHSTPEAQETIARITRAVAANADIPVGINLLPNDFAAAMRIAEETGGRFIQMDHIVGRFHGCQPVDVGYLQAMRARYPDIAVLGGVHPKYYEFEGPEPPISESAAKAAERGDAVVVTGARTGSETDLDDLKAVREALEHVPLVVGSGLTPENAPAQMGIADGAIVGSSIKVRGVVQGEPVDRELVERLMDRVRSS